MLRIVIQAKMIAAPLLRTNIPFSRFLIALRNAAIASFHGLTLSNVWLIRPETHLQDPSNTMWIGLSISVLVSRTVLSGIRRPVAGSGSAGSRLMPVLLIAAPWPFPGSHQMFVIFRHGEMRPRI